MPLFFNLISESDKFVNEGSHRASLAFNEGLISAIDSLRSFEYLALPTFPEDPINFGVAAEGFLRASEQFNELAETISPDTQSKSTAATSESFEAAQRFHQHLGKIVLVDSFSSEILNGVIAPTVAWRLIVRMAAHVSDEIGKRLSSTHVSPKASENGRRIAADLITAQMLGVAATALLASKS